MVWRVIISQPKEEENESCVVHFGVNCYFSFLPRNKKTLLCAYIASCISLKECNPPPLALIL